MSDNGRGVGGPENERRKIYDPGGGLLSRRGRERVLMWCFL